MGRYVKKGYNPKSLQNLKRPHEIMTHEQLSENAVKRNHDRAKKNAEARLFREIIKELGSGTLSKQETVLFEKLFGGSVDFSSIQRDSAVILAQYAKAYGGDTDAARFLRDTSGQAPTQSLQIGPLDAQSADLPSLSDDAIRQQLADLEASDGDSDGYTDD